MKWFQKRSIFSKILIGVFIVQLMTVCILVVASAFTKEPPKKKIIVRTVIPPRPIVQAANPPAKKELSQIKTPPKSPAKKEQTPKKSPVKPLKKDLKPIAKKEIKELPVPEKQEKSPIPPQRDPETPKEEMKEAVDYGQVLVHFFLNSLDLPDYGEVKMDLEIDHSGKIIGINTLESQSEINELFLKKRLPELVCPCNNRAAFSGESFGCTIVFKNN